MCGVAGFFGQSPLAPSALEAVFAALAQRGPDARHFVGWQDNGSRSDENSACHGLLHTRLSIRDPRPEADQPMANADGSIWICYNGEVYGWEEDARELLQAGYTFQTRSDTEFILHAYEHWGFEALLPRLRGMFALAILDWRTRTVWLARDRMGLKPLLYRHGQDGDLAFGSLVRAVLPFLPERKIDPEGLAAYLAHRYIPAPRTIFTGLKRLENGHYLKYSLGQRTLEKRRYWFSEPEPGDFRAELTKAVDLRTIADRPLGVFLSSGMDSALIASLLASTGHQSLSTFTASFANSAMDEADGAAAIARHYGLRNERIVIPNRIAADFPDIIASLDEPFADPSALPMWYLAREASKTVKVVLCGDGGDELFAGYKRYRQHLRKAWRGNLRLPFPWHADVLGRNKLAVEASLGWLESYSLRFSGFTPQQRAALLPTVAPDAHYWRETPIRGSALEQLLELDLDNYLPEYILRKADLVTMAHGQEGRAPLLDHHFVRRVLALPNTDRFTTPPKSALAPLLRDLPNGLNPLHGKKKGFNPPLANWLREDLRERYAGLGERLHRHSQGLLDAAAVERFTADYLAGNERQAEKILQLLMLDESLGQLA
ncbi:asparagine synthase (glutamine-hydrolyzing) [Chitinilyticum litopenaei]|uniref:asparagine synthase (glutamine-hydrolyzing) n=1 Tax=Chitinilyticum litopenaei TaxID=1121276 RepID=UPI00048FE46C|nr:asparagine synthase (glutamine-hydrolyzing) [Chitinilyticum litopenaei]